MTVREMKQERGGGRLFIDDSRRGRECVMKAEAVFRIQRVFPWVVFFLGMADGRLFSEDAPRYGWAAPVRLAVATCDQFPWVSDLPMTSDTVALLRRAAVEEWGLPSDQVRFWSNGSAEEFLVWAKELAAGSYPDTSLIFYFATHQFRNGETKFASGPNLSPHRLIETIHEIAAHYQRVLWIDDGCYAAALEKFGPFPKNVARIYASDSDQSAIDLDFDRGPYGLEEFLQEERRFLKEKKRWAPRGMSFLAVLSLKAAFSLGAKRAESIDVQMWTEEMNRWREEYDSEIRQAKVQRIVRVPSDQNFILLLRIH